MTKNKLILIGAVALLAIAGYVVLSPNDYEDSDMMAGDTTAAPMDDMGAGPADDKMDVDSGASDVDSSAVTEAPDGMGGNMDNARDTMDENMMDAEKKMDNAKPNDMGTGN